VNYQQLIQELRQRELQADAENGAKERSGI
jgi:hypothetical protein